MTPRRVCCRYIGKSGNRCTAEALEEGAEVELCGEHLARALQLLRRKGAA